MLLIPCISTYLIRRTVDKASKLHLPNKPLLNPQQAIGNDARPLHSHSGETNIALFFFQR
jgi:hypothetical protein